MSGVCSWLSSTTCSRSTGACSSTPGSSCSQRLAVITWASRVAGTAANEIVARTDGKGNDHMEIVAYEPGCSKILVGIFLAVVVGLGVLVGIGLGRGSRDKATTKDHVEALTVATQTA